jgi:hypothetical protein
MVIDFDQIEDARNVGIKEESASYVILGTFWIERCQCADKVLTTVLHTTLKT